MEQRHNSTDKRWDALYGRARLMLDEDGVAAESRRRETAERKLKRAGFDTPPVDLDLVKRTLLEYARTKRYALALESTAATKDEIDEERARASLEAARKRLESKTDVDDLERSRAETALQRAITRIDALK